MKYKFEILDGDKGEKSEIEAMSFKKALKSILISKPKFNGALYYTNKKGKYVMHSISKGKKQPDLFYHNPKLAGWKLGRDKIMRKTITNPKDYKEPVAKKCFKCTNLAYSYSITDDDKYICHNCSNDGYRIKSTITSSRFDIGKPN